MEKHDQEIGVLFRKAYQELGREEWAQAVQSFQKLLAQEDDPVFRNNLGLALYMEGDLEKTWEILQPNLKNGVLNPFARALAGMVLVGLRRSQEAPSYVKEAVQQFEAWASNPKALGIEPSAWWEYTVIIKRAAGLLEEHRLVADLHRRWERFYQTREDFFQAGVAFFNLKYYTRAAKVWSRVQGRDWAFLDYYIMVARVLEQGLAPSFTLPYSPPKLGGADREYSPEALDKLLVQGGSRALFLAQLFFAGLSRKKVEQLLTVLISRCGDWGLALGRIILESNSVPFDWKIRAGQILTDCGVFQGGEPINIVVDGEEESIVLEWRSVRPASLEQKVRLGEIGKILEQGRYEEALECLEKDLGEGDLSWEACHLVGRLYALLGKKEKAEGIANIFRGLAEQEEDLNFPYFVLTEIYLALGDQEMAQHYFQKICREGLHPDLKRRYQEFAQKLG